MRIIAGTHRGRKLTAPKGMATRPTTDRVREALFSILGPLHGARAVDLYAGSGALGFEALSRGAEHVWFIESGKAACQVLHDNAERLQFTSRATIVQREVQRAGSLLSNLDLVLSDPPWPIALEASAVAAKMLRGTLAPSARVVLGHPRRITLPDVLDGLVKQGTRNWGDSAMSFYAPTLSAEGASVEPKGPEKSHAED